MQVRMSSKFKCLFEDFPHDWLFYNELMADLIKENEGQDDVNDQSIAITIVINLLPIASANYCSQNNIEPIFKCNPTKCSYDSILENMSEPFDPNDDIHLKILENYVTLFVGETLFIFLEKSVEPLNSDLFDLLKDINYYYATKERTSMDLMLPINALDIWSRDFGLLSRFHFEE